MSVFNIDLAVKHVINIVNKNKCIACDLLNATYVRLKCGHYFCQICVTSVDECFLCSTNTATSNCSADEPLSQRMGHISNLLTTFQELFNLNVFRQHRNSEKLKIEKNIFPKCIQAPFKYCNKRKSILDNLIKDKENTVIVYPGENIRHNKVLKMENKNSYIQEWLNSSPNHHRKSRKPFAELKVNSNVYKKRTHNKTIFNKSKKLNKSPPCQGKISKEKQPLRDKENIKITNSKMDNDESGIVIDDDVVFIDESQNEYVDKDTLACFAVMEADKYHSKISEVCTAACIDQAKANSVAINITKSQNMTINKVPFYKKSSLCETCSYIENVNPSKSKGLTVVIDTNSFLATVKVLTPMSSKTTFINQHSVEIQTQEDNSENEKLPHNKESTNYSKNLRGNESKKKYFASTMTPLQQPDKNHENEKDMIYNNMCQENMKLCNSVKTRRVIVSESDSDNDVDSERINKLETVADVHPEKDVQFRRYGVLSKLEPHEYRNRQKQKGAGSRSPLSTDSSDKENYDPNRAKRQKLDKKPKK